MNKIVLVVLLMAACGPDVAEVKGACGEVLQEGLAECTEKAWGLCDMAYSEVMADMQKENQKLHDQIQALGFQIEAGCNTYLNGRVNDFMHNHGCTYEPQSQYGWVCYGGQLCVPYDPANP